MNSIYIPFSKRADLVVTDATQKARILTSAIALAIANNGQMPSSEVEDATNFFVTNVLASVRSIASCWNENMVFDYRACTELARAFWMIRYNAAYPARIPFYSMHTCFFNAITGVERYMSQEQQDFLEKFKNEILQLTIAAMEVNLELAKSDCAYV